MIPSTAHRVSAGTVSKLHRCGSRVITQFRGIAYAMIPRTMPRPYAPTTSIASPMRRGLVAAFDAPRDMERHHTRPGVAKRTIAVGTDVAQIQVRNCQGTAIWLTATCVAGRIGVSQ